MVKRILFVLVLAVLISGAAFAQNHWLSYEVSFVGSGGGLRYELMILKELSVGINGYFDYFILSEIGYNYGGDFSVRFYPFSGTFFIGIGVGYHAITGWDNNFSYSYSAGSSSTGASYRVNGIGITPEIGWKIDVGTQGAFFIQPGIKIPLALGTSEFRVYDGYSYNYKSFKRSKIDFMPIPYIGLGYAF